MQKSNTEYTLHAYNNNAESFAEKFNDYSSEPLAKVPFRPNSALCSKFYPWNIIYMPILKFFHMLSYLYVE